MYDCRHTGKLEELRKKRLLWRDHEHYNINDNDLIDIKHLQLLLHKDIDVIRFDINHDGYIYYIQEKNDINQDFVTSYRFDKSTETILNIYKCKIVDAKYIKKQDICQIIITNYLIYMTKTIKLNMNNPIAHTSSRCAYKHTYMC